METKNCQNCKNDFIVEEADFLFYQKMNVPAPTFCSFCRFVRRASYINERSLYKANCGLCKKSLVTMYHPDLNLVLYCKKCKYSDVWDAFDYGREYDFSQNFFLQFAELKRNVPQIALEQNESNGVGCEYSNFCFGSKESYLSFGVHGSENIKYSKYVYKGSKNCVDSYLIKKNDRCYETVRSNGNYNCSFLVESNECMNSSFLYDCVNCSNCFMSSNLRNQSYFFRNRKMSKDEYLNEMSSLGLDTYSGQSLAKIEFVEMIKNSIHRYADIKNSVNCTGDYIKHSKNCSNSYGLIESENLENSFIILNNPVQNSQDIMFTGRASECYETVYGGKGMNKVLFSISCGTGSQNLFYCDGCRDCKDCFGCVGLLHKQYCILNKQYTKEEYEELLPKIKAQMNEIPYVDKLGIIYKYGEYFPTELSPFAYNETMAFEEYPMSKEKVITLGYKWRDLETKAYASTLTAENIPEAIADISDTICSEVIACPNAGNPESRCTSAFKIIADELLFYRQMKLPVPRYCPNCRYFDRMKFRNPFKFWHRQCMCGGDMHGHEEGCQNQFETSYSPDRSEIIFCESCYQKEVM